MYRLTDVVKHLLIINVLAFLGTQLMGEPVFSSEGVTDWGRYQLGLFFPTHPNFAPYQVATHMFMHAGMTHLLFNMIGLFFFGPPLEMVLGPKRFLIYYLLTGLGAAALHTFVQYLEMTYFGAGASVIQFPAVGASGCVFGLLAGYAMFFPNNIISLIFPPISMRAKYFVLIYGAIELFMGVSNFNSGIAHFAHLGGAICGVLIIYIWRKTR